MDITLTPAYGRDYRSRGEVLKAFEDNLDFIFNCVGHPYDNKLANRTELKKAGVRQVNLRYKKLRCVFIAKI